MKIKIELYQAIKDVSTYGEFVADIREMMTDLNVNGNLNLTTLIVA